MTVHQLQITAARLTPAGRGAVATIRVSAAPSPPGRAGESVISDSTWLEPISPLFHAASGIPLSESPLHKIVYGKWGTNDFEDLVACRTSMQTVEIHCHGGDAAVRRVLADLATAGCKTVDWREQVTLADGLLQAECREVMSRTSTWRTTKYVLEQTNGLLRSAFEQIVDLVGTTPTKTQQTEDERAPHPAPLSARPGREDESCRSVSCGLEMVEQLLTWADFGLHLSTPWSVVLTGRPNVGKSSLINALLGYQRAIVFDQPGTTRDVVTGETAFDGWPVQLADTAGIRARADELEAAGIALAEERLMTADLRIVLIDNNQAPTPDDLELLKKWPDAVVVAHKADLANHWGRQLPSQAIAVSSVTGFGLAELQSQLVRRLVPDVPSTGTAIPLTLRQIRTLKEIRSATTESCRSAAARQLLSSPILYPST
jgi:tRNA modification GTPase